MIGTLNPLIGANYLYRLNDKGKTFLKKAKSFVSSPPSGWVFRRDADGAYIRDADGAYILDKE